VQLLHIPISNFVHIVYVIKKDQKSSNQSFLLAFNFGIFIAILEYQATNLKLEETMIYLIAWLLGVPGIVILLWILLT